MSLLSARAINAVLENCVNGILHDVFTFCRGNVYCRGELRHWNTAEYVYLLSEQYIIDMETCVTGILQNVSLK